MKTTTDLFLMGLVMAWGPCFYYCTPIILSYLAGTKPGWFKGAINILIFSLFRMIAYVIVIIIAFLIGNSVIRSWYEIGYGKVLYYVAGVITIILGLLLLLGKDILHSRFCSILLKKIPFFMNSTNLTSPTSLTKPTNLTHLTSMIILGFVIGIAPCIPLFGVINYIVFETKSLPQAIIYALCFGIGTVLGPLIPLGVFAGSITGIAARTGKFLKLNIKPDLLKLNLFSRLCGAALIYFGIKLIK